MLGALAVIILGGLFFGAQYAQNKGMDLNLAQMYNGEMKQNGMMNQENGMMAEDKTGVTMGNIVSMDETSITIKTPDGNTRKVFMDGSTGVIKSMKGNKSDLRAGQNVGVMGEVNPDGSVNAKMIQLKL